MCEIGMCYEHSKKKKERLYSRPSKVCVFRRVTSLSKTTLMDVFSAIEGAFRVFCFFTFLVFYFFTVLHRNFEFLDKIVTRVPDGEEAPLPLVDSNPKGYKVFQPVKREFDGLLYAGAGMFRSAHFDSDPILMIDGMWPVPNSVRLASRFAAAGSALSFHVLCCRAHTNTLFSIRKV